MCRVESWHLYSASRMAHKEAVVRRASTQYSMTRRYSTASVRGYHGCMPSIQKWILNCKPVLGVPSSLT